MEFCSFINLDGTFCGLLANHATRCNKHLGKEIKIRNKGPRFRGDSAFQVENGMGSNKTGSNV